MDQVIIKRKITIFFQEINHIHRCQIDVKGDTILQWNVFSLSDSVSTNIHLEKCKLDLTPYRSDQIRSVSQSSPTLCNPMNHSMPGLPVHHQHPECTQTHVHHRVSDAIQPSHPLASPSPPAPNPSQHQSLFQ